MGDCGEGLTTKGGQYEVMGRVLYPDLMVVIVIQPSAYAKTQNCTLKSFHCVWGIKNK